MQKLYEAVLGEKNSAYYLSKFQQFDQQPTGLKASWNWSAFLFSGFWLKDKSLADLDNLPEPDDLAAEIIENLEAGLACFREIAVAL